MSALGYEINLLAQQLIGVILHMDSPAERASLLTKLANSVSGAQLTLCVDAVDRSREAQALAAVETRPKFARIDPERVAVDIVSVEHRQSQRTASDMVSGALELYSKFPRIWNRVVAGDLPAAVARTIVKRLRNVVDPEKRATIEAVFLNRMDRDKSPAFWSTHLAKQLDRVISEVDPDGVEEQEKQAGKNRKVTARPSRSGMASLSAKLPALECATISERHDSISKEWGDVEGEDRGADELRADALVQLLTGLDKSPTGMAGPKSTSSAPAIQPRITLVADVDPSLARCRAWAGKASVAKSKLDELLMGTSRAHLHVVPARHDVGLGDLNALTSFLERIGSDFKEQTSYAPTDSIRRLVTERDGTCRHPGCTHPAEQCDLDHVIPFDKKNPLSGGLTREDNLIALCRHHHRFKTHGNCTHHLDPDGTVYARIGDDCVGSSSPQGHRGILREEIDAGYSGGRSAILDESARLAQAAWRLAAQLDELVIGSIDTTSTDESEESPAHDKGNADVIELRSALREKMARRFREQQSRSRWDVDTAGSSALDLDLDRLDF